MNQPMSVHAVIWVFYNPYEGGRRFMAEIFAARSLNPFAKLRSNLSECDVCFFGGAAREREVD
jgi:hypothetical protein